MSPPSGGGSQQDPCKHPNNKKKRKYVVYIAMDMDTGKMYVGRTSGPPGMDTNAILDKRRLSHHRNLSNTLVAVCETDSYAAVRGAEEKHQKAFASRGQGTTQINPISPTNKNKANYEKCAEQTNKKTCSICGGG